MLSRATRVLSRNPHKTHLTEKIGSLRKAEVPVQDNTVGGGAQSCPQTDGTPDLCSFQTRAVSHWQLKFQILRSGRALENYSLVLVFLERL